MRALPILLSAAVVLASVGCRPAPRQEIVGTPAAVASSASWNMKDKITKTDAEWRQQLTSEQFRVLREHGTERAFSGAFARSHDPGSYHCAGCGLDLFGADAKFESGTGWPSFWKPTRPSPGESMPRTACYLFRLSSGASDGKAKKQSQATLELPIFS